MRRSKIITVAMTSVLLLVALVPPSAAQRDSELEREARSLTGNVFAGTSMESLRQLCDRIGPRVAGTKGYQDAAAWAAAQFRAGGIKDVHLEPFTIPSGWQRGWAHSQIYSPIQRRLHLETVSWAPSTPPGGVKGEITVITDLSEADLRSEAAEIKGRIVLLDTERVFADGFNKTYARLIASYPLFKSMGALALVLNDTVPNAVLGDWLDIDNGKAEIQPLPIAEIGMEDYKLLRRLVEEGPVTIGFEYQNQITGPTQINNVVAEIRGSERPDEWILIGAHLDSWDLGTGCQDNGTGSVMVLEVAKAFAALPYPPQRSVRFVLWTGEEPGLLGSRFYVKQHVQELDKCVAVLNTDNGAGHPKGWKVEGRQDLKEAMTPVASTYLRDLSADGISMEVTFDTDHGPFMLHGIPAFDLWVEDAPYEAVHHKPSDTFDKVDPIFLKADTAIVAVTGYVIAQMSKPIAPHLDHSAVGEILKKAELDQYLITHGDWVP
jgi:carboxypeptidase Q